LTPKKASIITVVLAAIGLVFTVVGMFTTSLDKTMIGIAFWIASVVTGKLIKKKIMPKN
jgi:hypothetical protein